MISDIGFLFVLVFFFLVLKSVLDGCFFKSGPQPTNQGEKTIGGKKSG